MMVWVASSMIPCTSPGPGAVSVPPLPLFLSQVVLNARLGASTLMMALGYLIRLRACLPPTAQGKMK